MKIIYTKKRQEILVDDDVYEWASLISWHVDKDGYASHGYSKNDRLIYKKKCVKLHHLILECPVGLMRDHANNNKLDNQRKNLRICTNTQNSQNKLLTKRNKSGYKGVTWDKYKNKWEANITVGGKIKFLGYSNDPEYLSKIYDLEAIKNFGEFANTNWPVKKPEKVPA